MNNQAVKISNCLIELRDAGLSTTIENYDNLKKYDIIFSGSNFNSIFAHEFCYALNNYFNIVISLENLLEILPDICEPLSMKLEPLVRVSDIDKSPRPIADYYIFLF